MRTKHEQGRGRTKAPMALLAALALWAGSAGAELVIVDRPDNGPERRTTQAVYALETFHEAHREDPTDPQDLRTYYVIDGELGVAATADGGAPGENVWRVHYTLENMVFAEKARHEPEHTARLIKGGNTGDKFATFEAVGAVHPREELRLIAHFAIDVNSEGNVHRSVTNQWRTDVGGGGTSQMVAGYGLIAVRPALVEEIRPAPTTPLADNASQYREFERRNGQNPRESAIALVRIGVVSPPLRDASRGGADVLLIEDFTEPEPGRVEALPIRQRNELRVEGDFSFTRSVGVTEALGREPGDACERNMQELKPDKEEPWARTQPIPIDGRWDTPLWICVSVPGDTYIPATAPYRVVTEYARRPYALAPALGGTHQVSGIEREGTSFEIPKIRAGWRHHQRITVVNRGRPTEYAFIDWQSSKDGWMEPAKAAKGMLKRGVTIIDTRELVTMEDGDTASAILAIGADPHAVSVSMETYAMNGYGRDTIVLEPEQRAR